MTASTSEVAIPPTDPALRTVAMARLAPGIVAAALATVAAVVIQKQVPQLSTLIIAVVIGIAIGNAGERTDRLRPGLTFVAKRLLRVGVALLGIRLSLGQVFDLGAPALLLVVGTVTATFFGTQALGRRLGLSHGLSLLIATGYSICGASAIAAMESTAEADDEEVALAIGLVTLAGTAAMFVLPPLASLLGLSPAEFGAWTGASVHDVAQVVAAASTGGAEVLAIAVVVKLTRVVLLAPIVAGTNMVKARRRSDDDVDETATKPPLMPMFVVIFLIFMVVRSIGVVPDRVVDDASWLTNILLTTALVGLGAGVRFDRLRKLGAAPVVVGVLAWALVALVSLAGTKVLI